MKGDVGAFGCVLRDSSGHVLESFGEKLEAGCSVLLSEALAVRRACIFCAKSGLNHMCIESNSSQLSCSLAQQAKSDGVPPWDIAAVIFDIHSLASSHDLSFA